MFDLIEAGTGGIVVGMDELVLRLSRGMHPVEISLRSDRTAAGLKRRIDEYGFVHIRFLDTVGGTELGIQLDKQRSTLSTGDFDKAQGHIQLYGRLMLNYVPVACVADIALSSLKGEGRLEVIDKS